MDYTREQLEAMTEEELDEIVHDLKAEEAAEINNQGKEAQITYILG
jgi:ribosomal protein L29